MATLPDMTAGEGLIRTHDLLEHLADDVYRSFEILEGDKRCQYLRRVSVRNVFSFTEGVVQILKHEIKSDIRMKRYPYILTKKDKEVLYEEKENDGKITQFFIPIEENIKKTFALASKVWELSNFVLDTNSVSYACFLRCKKSRNRLTHPRTFYDIDISDEEMADFASSFLWANSEFKRIMQLKIDDIAKNLPPEIWGKLG